MDNTMKEIHQVLNSQARYELVEYLERREKKYIKAYASNMAYMTALQQGITININQTGDKVDNINQTGDKVDNEFDGSSVDLKQGTFNANH